MYYECKKCKEDLFDLINYDTLTEDYIECPKCKHKMEVHYDEIYYEKTFEEEQIWWLEDYIN